MSQNTLQKKHFLNGFNGWKLMVCNGICDGDLIFCDGSIDFICFFFLAGLHHCLYNAV